MSEEVKYTITVDEGTAGVTMERIFVNAAQKGVAAMQAEFAKMTFPVLGAGGAAAAGGGGGGLAAGAMPSGQYAHKFMQNVEGYLSRILLMVGTIAQSGGATAGGNPGPTKTPGDVRRAFGVAGALEAGKSAMDFGGSAMRGIAANPISGTLGAVGNAGMMLGALGPEGLAVGAAIKGITALGQASIDAADSLADYSASTFNASMKMSMLTEGLKYDISQKAGPDIAKATEDLAKAMVKLEPEIVEIVKGTAHAVSVMSEIGGTLGTVMDKTTSVLGAGMSLLGEVLPGLITNPGKLPGNISTWWQSTKKELFPEQKKDDPKLIDEELEASGRNIRFGLFNAMTATGKNAPLIDPNFQGGKGFQAMPAPGNWQLGPRLFNFGDNADKKKNFQAPAVGAVPRGLAGLLPNAADDTPRPEGIPQHALGMDQPPQIQDQGAPPVQVNPPTITGEFKMPGHRSKGSIAGMSQSEIEGGYNTAAANFGSNSAQAHWWSKAKKNFSAAAMEAAQNPKGPQPDKWPKIHGMDLEQMRRYADGMVKKGIGDENEMFRDLKGRINYRADMMEYAPHGTHGKISVPGKEDYDPGAPYQKLWSRPTTQPDSVSMRSAHDRVIDKAMPSANHPGGNVTAGGMPRPAPASVAMNFGGTTVEAGDYERLQADLAMWGNRLWGQIGHFQDERWLKLASARAEA